MATLREFILNQSSLPTGNMVRDHIQNPGSGGGTIILGEVEIDVEQGEVEIDVVDAVSVEVQQQDIMEVEVISAVSVEIEHEETTVETCK